MIGLYQRMEELRILPCTKLDVSFATSLPELLPAFVAGTGHWNQLRFLMNNFLT